ncbi:MAG: Cation diffusion facilitator family transporter [Frankiales bacterium]|jgi:cation diffusion facilitator family transporter|nr:Cation diffusion facilitator family transporter [Frankiales bacterium]
MDDEPAPGKGAAESGTNDESRLTVLLALAANLLVAVLKLIAGLLSGSGALLSEAAHSFGDTSTELFLLTALRRAGRDADRQHPFGYGKERYFWSLLAAMAIFISGAVFSVYEGVHTIVSDPDQRMAWLNYLVLAIAAGLEGTSLRQGLRQARGAARRSRRTLADYVRNPEDPTVKSVVLEDSVALIGLALAAAGVALQQLTGLAVYDGLASIAIGLLLVLASAALAQTCRSLLVGQQADPRLMRAIEARLEEQPEVDDVVDMLTMVVGTGSVLLCARVDFIDTFSAADLERACVRIDESLRAEFSALGEIFLEPVPRLDPGTRDRVLRRYGNLLTD